MVITPTFGVEQKSHYKLSAIVVAVVVVVVVIIVVVRQLSNDVMI